MEMIPFAVDWMILTEERRFALGLPEKGTKSPEPDLTPEMLHDRYISHAKSGKKYGRPKKIKK